MQDLASRIHSRIQLTTDGHRVYVDAVEDASGAGIDYAMVKIYDASNENPESLDAAVECLPEVPILTTFQLHLWSAAIFQCEWECAVSRG